MLPRCCLSGCPRLRPSSWLLVICDCLVGVDVVAALVQDCGLDPIVANLELERVNPHLRQLAQATQASAVSSLMELGSCMRTDADLNDTTSKRARDFSDFHAPEALESASKLGTRETPVRKRISVDGSPTCKKGLAGFDSPTSHDFGTPGNGNQHVHWTPRQSSRARNGEDVQNAVAALLATPKGADRIGKGKKNGKLSSDDEGGGTPPRSHLASAAGKGTSTNSSSAAPATNTFLMLDKDKKNQGLRQFSLRVCRQVELKGTTTYNEVADELVKEFKDEETDSDEKNIRRRAYDALNVLTAMDIISKDKKDIQWKGFPPMAGDSGERQGGASSGRDKEKARLKAKIEQKQKELRQKEGHLKELLTQFVSLKQLLSRNQRPEYAADPDKHHRIYLPFVIVNTDADNTIECEIGEDKRSAEFNCTKPFKLYDDRETLSLMRMGQCDQETLSQMLPDPSLIDFLRKNHANPLVGEIIKSEAVGDDCDDNGECEDMEDDEAEA